MQTQQHVLTVDTGTGFYRMDRYRAAGKLTHHADLLGFDAISIGGVLAVRWIGLPSAQSRIITVDRDGK